SHRRKTRAAYRASGPDAGRDAVSPARVSRSAVVKENAMQRLVDIAPPQVPHIWSLLSQIPDPEVPVLTITDLGMVRSVTAQGEGWVIGFTPTYSGCPATEHLLGAIRDTLTAHGYTPVHIVLQLEPAWTTDWMTADARERLRAYGISPP